MSIKIATTITYFNQSRYVGRRPVADVVVNRTGPTLHCLVDTGADYMQIPASLTTAVGLDAAYKAAQVSGSTRTVTTASGHTIAMVLVRGIDVEIDGYICSGVDILFDPGGGPLLLGRQAFLRASPKWESGFDDANWFFSL
jgi:predicted aspartyl protease